MGYTMGTERLAELLYEAVRGEIANLEELIGGTKAITTMLEGAIGTRCKSIEGCHPTIWGSVAELSTTTKHHHEAINSILKTVLELQKRSNSQNVSFLPGSGVTEPNSSLEGGLTAEPFFNQEGFPGAGLPKAGNEPTIKDGYSQRHQGSTAFSGASSSGSSGGGGNSDSSRSGSLGAGGQGSSSVPGLQEG